MHLWIITITLMLAVGLRFVLWKPSKPGSLNSWSQRWARALSSFLVPPMLLLITAFTMIQMGTEGVMLGIPVGEIGFVIGVGFIVSAGVVLVVLWGQGWRSLQRVRRCPIIVFQANSRNHSGRLLDTSIPFAGEVGFWHSELVVSQGLLSTLTPEQVSAVMAHEAAHTTYRDTFWFFWLGWVRTLTCWLPLTQTLWHEMLLLRETRADRQAAQSVDPLLLAESLLAVVAHSAPPPIPNCAAFHQPASTLRLEERVNALLTSDSWEPEKYSFFMGLQFVLALIPLVAIALHH